MAVYAIHTLDGKIVKEIKNTWPECEAMVKHHSATYKKFNNNQEAKKWFNVLDSAEPAKKRYTTPKSNYKPTHGKGTKTITFTLPTSTYNSFVNKLIKMNTSSDQILTSFINEWIGGFEPEEMITLPVEDNSEDNGLPWD